MLHRKGLQESLMRHLLLVEVAPDHVRFTFVRWWLERTGQRIEEITPCTPS
jgi:hypothetical protein